MDTSSGMTSVETIAGFQTSINRRFTAFQGKTGSDSPHLDVSRTALTTAPDANPVDNNFDVFHHHTLPAVGPSLMVRCMATSLDSTSHIGAHTMIQRTLFAPSRCQAGTPLSVAALSVSPTPVDVPRVEGLSYREFVHDFQRLRRPVILTDATRNWSARGWSLETLQRRAGHRTVTIRTETGSANYLFGDLVDLLSNATDGQPAPYARNVDVERNLPELWPDIQPRLEFATPDWKSSGLLPRDFIFPNGLEELFLGGVGNSFPRLHVDYWGMDGFVSQILGRKEFILAPPSQTPFMYPTPGDELSSQITDLDQVDFERFPMFAQAAPARITLEPGDTLYNPNGWWHTTVMRELSLTVITATWNSSNWKTFRKQYRQRGKTRGLSKLCMLGYLAAVGSVLSIRDQIKLMGATPR